MRKPDFFIVGAPKCGTTSLYEYLRQHPEIFMADPKEPHYFSADLTFQRPRPVASEERYLALFRGARGEKRLGEASTTYLQSRVAAERIHAFQPEARLIAMLRNPIDAIASLHSHLIAKFREDIPSLRDALAAEADRREGRRIPTGTNVVEQLCYREVVSYAEQLDRYFSVFGAQRVFVIVFDDFKHDTAGVYGQVLRFLGVEPSFLPQFVVAGANKVVRSPALQRLHLGLPPSMRNAGKAILPRRLRRLFLSLAAPERPRSSVDSDLRQSLRIELEPEVARLSSLLGRDLTHWCRN